VEERPRTCEVEFHLTASWLVTKWKNYSPHIAMMIVVQLCFAMM
jgi:hypothetical protein